VKWYHPPRRIAGAPFFRPMPHARSRVEAREARVVRRRARRLAANGSAPAKGIRDSRRLPHARMTPASEDALSLTICVNRSPGYYTRRLPSRASTGQVWDSSAHSAFYFPRLLKKSQRSSATPRRSPRRACGRIGFRRRVPVRASLSCCTGVVDHVAHTQGRFACGRIRWHITCRT